MNRDWAEKLERAALPGSADVQFSWTRTEDGVSLRLICRDEAGAHLGDDRDYDLLKVHFEALGALAEQAGYGAVGEARSALLNLRTGALSLTA